MSIAIVTDSTSDIPGNLLSCHNIHQIPVTLTLENQTYQDGFDLSREKFYSWLSDMPSFPTTGAPSTGSFQKLYHQLFSRGHTEIISIHAASNLSGICNAARIAGRDFENRVHVYDSQQLSMGLGYQVLAAARAAADQIPLEKIISTLDDFQQKIRVFALLDSFKYIHRSGRVSWAKTRLGSLLKIKPLVELEAGSVIQRGLARARSQGIKLLTGTLDKLGDLSELSILHTNAEEEGKMLQQYFASRVPELPLLVNVTTIIGSHVGPNGLGFAAVVK